MEHSLTLLQVNLLFILMFLAAHFLRKLQIPPIISFLLVGFLAKLWLPHESTKPLELFKEAGIILLFFFIGLEYSFERLRNMVSVWKPGVIDLVLNFFPVLLLSYALGFDLITSLIIAGVFYPSSTSIVAKLLMDFKRLASPEAELLIGILIFEDLIAILLLSVLIPMSEFGSLEPKTIPVSLLKILVVLVVFYFIYSLLLPRIKSWLDRVSEDENFVFLLLGGVLAVGLLFKETGLSEALGAFLLGVLIPETRVMENIEHHLSAFKELSIGVFFFFFAYESELAVPEKLGFVLVLIALGIGLKVVSTYLAAYVYGMKRKARLRTSLSFVPRGEFSVIIASLEPSVKLLSIPFIFATALIGSFLFVVAPRVADWVYPPKKKPPRKRRAPKELSPAPAS
ncbi:cation:proton antiporter [Hydrogenivirga sp.]